jgi:hypothetical protein
MTEFHGESVRGMLTKFQFACEYRKARTHEELRVFEPSDGGNPEIDDYRIEMVSATGTPTTSKDQN